VVVGLVFKAQLKLSEIALNDQSKKFCGKHPSRGQ